MRYWGIICLITVVFMAPLPAFAESHNQNLDDPIHHYGLAFGTFILAGLAYSMMGYVKKLRRAFDGVSKYPDPTKVAKSAIVAIMVGVGGFITTLIAGDPMTVSDFDSFLALYTIATTAVVTVDKLLLGGGPSQSKQPAPAPSGSVAPPPPPPPGV